MMLRGVGLAIAIVVAVSVGLGVFDEQRERMEAAVIDQADAACDEQLPGDGWRVAKATVNTSKLDGAQDVLCSRNGTWRKVSIDIEVQLKG